MPLEGILAWWKKWNSRRDDERLIEDKPPIPVVLVAAQGSGGEMIFGANALEGPTVGGQAAINTNVTSLLTYTDKILSQSQGPRWSDPIGAGSGTTQFLKIAPHLFQSTLTATAGGEIVAADVGPPTLASYQSAMILTHVFSDQTQANISFTIAPSAGAFTTGLTGMDISTTANTVTPDYNQGLAWLCGTDAATIQFACAAGQAGNAQNITFCGVYWYET